MIFEAKCCVCLKKIVPLWRGLKCLDDMGKSAVYQANHMKRV